MRCFEMNEPDELDFRLSSYCFDLPEARIAQSPATERSGSRLMVLRRESDSLEQAMFSDLIRFLPEGCLLVANNSQVVPARVTGKRPSGGKLEFLLLTPLPLIAPRPAGAELLEHPAGVDAAFVEPLSKRAADEWQEAEAEGLLRPAKKIAVGELLPFAPDFALRVLDRGDFGRCRVRLYWKGKLQEVLERRGSLPLPPYIRRAGQDDRAAGDAERYQTTYARPDKAGSVAAPTAGLHFTPALREELERSGREWAEVTLYVGYGTFSPVRSADIREHAMHAEYAELPERTLAAIARARAEGRAVIAVGTTSARVLEGIRELRPELFTVFSRASAREEEAAASAGGATSGPGLCSRLAFAGWLSTFLYPGKTMGVIDGLITNFHLPESSLLMLVSALAGRERVLRAYRQAIDNRFRFFSYGDAMLIL